MLKKLYAYEYRSLFRSLLPVYIGLLCFALAGRMLYLLDGESLAYTLLTGLTAAFYIFAILAFFVVGAVMIVTRFYKNLLGGEGYLTLTLPFTPTQHIVCKLVCAVSVMIVNLLVVFLSLLILGAGSDVMDGLFTMVKEMLRQYMEVRLVGVIAEGIVYVILSFFQGVLMFYAAMAIGQCFKSRIGGAVLAYIGLYAAIEAAQLCFAAIMGAKSEAIEEFLMEGFGSILLALLLPIVWSAILSLVFFFLTRYFLTKRLNLE